jgi:hypothetical protein
MIDIDSLHKLNEGFPQDAPNSPSSDFRGLFLQGDKVSDEQMNHIVARSGGNYCGQRSLPKLVQRLLELFVHRQQPVACEYSAELEMLGERLDHSLGLVPSSSRQDDVWMINSGAHWVVCFLTRKVVTIWNPLGPTCWDATDNQYYSLYSVLCDLGSLGSDPSKHFQVHICEEAVQLDPYTCGIWCLLGLDVFKQYRQALSLGGVDKTFCTVFHEHLKARGPRCLENKKQNKQFVEKLRRQYCNLLQIGPSSSSGPPPQSVGSVPQTPTHTVTQVREMYCMYFIHIVHCFNACYFYMFLVTMLDLYRRK